MRDTKQEEIDYLRNNPEIMASIRKGLQDCHLGRIFSGKEVFGCYKDTGDGFFSRLYYRSIINLKKIWWDIKSPWQKFISHRNCSQCQRYRSEH